MPTLLTGLGGGTSPQIGPVQSNRLMPKDFVPKSRAPTIDDIFAAVKAKKLIAGENVLKLLEEPNLHKALSQHVEQFNFGTLKNEVISEAAKESFDFIEDALMPLPYPVSLYRCNIIYDNGLPPAGVSLLVVCEDRDDLTKPFAVVDFMHDAENDMVALHSMCNMKIEKDQHGERSVELQVYEKEVQFWRKRIVTHSSEPPNIAEVADGCMVAMGLTMVLNTKGVDKERVAPPRKPNQHRAASGRPLLPWVTRVDTTVYALASEPGTGTHASPRPHRRRGHVRRYPATEYREAYCRPIAPMLVNWDGRPLERGEYRVPHGEQ